MDQQKETTSTNAAQGKPDAAALRFDSRIIAKSTDAAGRQLVQLSNFTLPGLPEPGSFSLRRATPE